MEREKDRTRAEHVDQGWRALAEFAWSADETADGGAPESLIHLLPTAVFLPLVIAPERVGGQVVVASELRLVRHTPAFGLTIARAEVLEGDQATLLRLSRSGVDMYLGGDTRIAIELSDGRKILLQGGPTLRLLEARSPRIDGLVDLPPFQVDVAALAGDPWLREKLARHLELKDAWHTAVAAALYATCGPPNRTGGIVPHAVNSPAHRWIEQLNLQQRSAVQVSAAARVDRLWLTMNRLENEFLPADERWRAVFVEWCLEREDLEGVRQLMKWGQFAGHLLEAIAVFDRAAFVFARSVPVEVPTGEEQLRRAAVLRPGAWWVNVLSLYPRTMFWRRRTTAAALVDRGGRLADKVRQDGWPTIPCGSDLL